MKRKLPAAATKRFVSLTSLFFAALLFAALFGLSSSRTATAQYGAGDENIVGQIGYQEKFDTVAAPQLPNGWTTTISGDIQPFLTTTVTPDSPPNCIFTNDPSTVALSEVTSPQIRIGGNSPKLFFRHFYNTESTFDGGVLEIKIGSGAFQDILTAGGSFASSGYNLTINGGFSNPLANRMAWSGNSTNYVTTEVNLPVAAYRQQVQFKWRMGSDNSVASVGWRIDDVQVTNAISGENVAAISIPVSGVAAPYPSEITLTDHPGIVTGVQVNLQNFGHTSPDDVDLMLVAPNGRRVILMSDVGGTTAVSNLNISIDDAATAALPDSAALTSGAFKPTNFETGDAFPAPAPQGAPTGTFLASLNGSPANGVWQLFLVDDNGGNAGAVTGGWSIAVQSSLTAIDIPSVGAATPFPSERVISNQTGSVTRVVVNIDNFSHAAPDDADIMLVAPNGRKVILMSDVGGSTAVGNLSFTFDDAAANSLPDNAPLQSGTYKPTNFEAGDAFPAPAPQGAPTGATLNSFYGIAPNGTWKLYVVDDTGENFGFVVDWRLTLEVSSVVCLMDFQQTLQTYPAAASSGSFGFRVAEGCEWSVRNDAPFVTLTTQTTGSGDTTVNFNIQQNDGGDRVGFIVVTVASQVRTFLIDQVASCPTPAGNVNQTFNAAGGVGQAQVAAATNCVWRPVSTVNWIQISNAPNNGNQTLPFTVLPNTGQNGRTAIIGIGLQTFNITQAGAGGKRFDFDGDGKADVAVFRPSNGSWYALRSTNSQMQAAQWGANGDKIVPADYDGDRKTDFAVYRNGFWYILESSTGGFRSEFWGLSTDIPTVGDYDGDKKADVAVYRASTGSWYARRSSDYSFLSIQFGIATDKPVQADYDADGKTDVAVYRAGTASSWQILRSSDGTTQTINLGTTGDIPAPADYDGDGRDNAAVFRPSNGTWYTNSTNPNFAAVQWGASGDVPAPADYNGDERADFTIFRNGIWYTLFAGTTNYRIDYWGLPTDTPAPANQ